MKRFIEMIKNGMGGALHVLSYGDLVMLVEYIRASFILVAGARFFYRSRLCSARNRDTLRRAFVGGFFVTEKCSLKCKYCAALVQYIQKPEDLPYETVVSDIDNYFAKVKYTYNLSVKGGEIFLYKDCGKVLEHLYKYRKQYAQLSVTTNATIVPSDALCELMRKLSVRVMVSDYGENSRHKTELTEKLKRFKVLYVVSNKGDSWVEMGIPTEKGSIDAAEVFSKCRPCLWIKNGKLYLCSFAGNGDSCGIIPKNEGNSVPLKATSDEVWAFIAQNTPIPGCDYCGGSWKNVPAGKDQVREPMISVFQKQSAEGYCDVRQNS